MNKNTSNSRNIRKFSFYFAICVLPVIFFAGLEVILRLVGFGNSYPLVNRETVFGKERYVLNREVSQRYFNLPPDKTPQAQAEYFDIQKKKKILRLFCLGGSTTAGFPFEMNATFPFQLQYRLRNELFDQWAEVINLGIAAVNSYTVLDLLPEVLELQPDGLIVYMGHNEFYGALGVGSTQYFSSNRTVVKGYLKLRKLRLTQLLQRIIGKIMQGVAEKSPAKSMMNAMVREQSIPLNSEMFRQACDNFEENLNEIVQIAKAHDVPIILCTLVSNLKDQPPFAAQFSPKLTGVKLSQAQKLLHQGQLFLETGEPQKALNTLAELADIDTVNAQFYYEKGQALQLLGDSLSAYQAFQKAKDFDQLRFRAPEKFNKIIQDVAMENNVPLVDMQKIFQAASPAKTPGNNLFLEHLHPNFDGYRLMAHTLQEALRAIQIINPPEPIHWQKELFSPKQETSIFQNFRESDGGVTSLDMEFGLLRNFYLLHQWPFPEKPVTIDDYHPYGSNKTKKVAVDRLKNHTPWEASHYELADAYLKNEQYDSALAEYRAVRLKFVEDYYPVMKLGDVNVLKKDYPKALEWYKKALDAAPGNARVLGKMGHLYASVKNFSKAEGYLKQAVEADANGTAFTQRQRAEIYYLLGASYANMKRFSEAQQALAAALKVKPNYSAALKLKAQIQNYLDKQK